MNEKELIEACERFLKVWHENGRADHERRFRSLPYDTDEAKSLKVRRDWICLDSGTSGVDHYCISAT
jgi:hypothetical protein